MILLELLACRLAACAAFEDDDDYYYWKADPFTASL